VGKGSFSDTNGGTEVRAAGITRAFTKPMHICMLTTNTKKKRIITRG